MWFGVVWKFGVVRKIAVCQNRALARAPELPYGAIGAKSRCACGGMGGLWWGGVFGGMVVWYGMVWCGMVWYGVVWYGVVWYGVMCLKLTVVVGTQMAKKPCVRNVESKEPDGKCWNVDFAVTVSSQ